MITTAAIREHYDSLALVYRAFWGDHIHHGLFTHPAETPAQAQVNLVDHCAALVEPAGQVLDVGCGHGGGAIRLAQRGCRVLGLTLSEKQARLARQHADAAGLNGAVRFVVHDAEHYEYPAESFDVVWTMEASEHFFDKAAYFANVFRTLSPGGRMLLAAWTGSMQSPAVREVARRFLCPGLWTAEQYGDAMMSAGLGVRGVEDLTGRVQRTWEICGERARAAGPAVRLLPAAAREFVGGIEIILGAYRSGELSYSVIHAEKPRA